MPGQLMPLITPVTSPRLAPYIATPLMQVCTNKRPRALVRTSVGKGDPPAEERGESNEPMRGDGKESSLAKGRARGDLRGQNGHVNERRDSVSMPLALMAEPTLDECRAKGAQLVARLGSLDGNPGQALREFWRMTAVEWQ
jgi:hypothetical protein